MSPDRLFSHEYLLSEVEDIYVAGNRGPCGGVNMALEASNQVLDIVDGREKVYSLWDVIHNKPEMERLSRRGLVSVNYQLQNVPDNSIVIKPAHGGPPWLNQYANDHGWQMVDVTCQLVEQVQDAVKRDANGGKKTGYIGVGGHPETIGVLGVLEEMGKRRGVDFELFENEHDVEESDLGTGFDWVVRSQTTLMPAETDVIEDRLKDKYPDIYVPDKLGICYATYNRQEAVDDMIKNKEIDRLVVVGSAHSHNSQMLRRRGDYFGVKSYLVDDPSGLSQSWFIGDVRKVGVTSGASVLDVYMERVVDSIAEQSAGAKITYLEQVKAEKPMTFKLPKDQIEALKARFAA